MEVISDGVIDKALLSFGLAPRLILEDNIVIPAT